MSAGQNMSDQDEKFIAEPKLGFDRRRHPRRPAHLSALVVDDAGKTSPCVIMDHSQSGFRIRLLSADHLADQFGLIDLLSGVGHEGQLVWHEGQEIGARSSAQFDLRSEQNGVGLTLQQIWRTALA